MLVSVSKKENKAEPIINSLVFFFKVFSQDIRTEPNNFFFEQSKPNSY
jgi:hypothetical protein